MEDRLEPVRDVADPSIDEIFIGECENPDEDLFEAHGKYIRLVFEILKKEEFIIGK